MSDDSLWQEAVRWLTEFRVLPEPQAPTEPGASGSEVPGSGTAGFAECSGQGLMSLAHALRDGVLLCHLLHTIDSSSVQMASVSLRPQMAQFLCLKNIRVFLTSCSQVYDIDTSDLFEPAMLFDYSDFGKVLRTLSVLSFTPKALSHGISGFPRGGRHTCPGLFHEEIYRRLDHHANEVCSDSCEAQANFAHSSEQELIYYKLTRFESQTTAASVPPRPAPPLLEQRDHCLNELLETETNYLRVLRQLRRGFAEPLAAFFSGDDSAVIFHCVKELETLHSELSLELCQSTPAHAASVSGHQVASVFVAFKSRFLIYGDYCTNLERAQQLLEKLCDCDDNLAARVTKCEQDVNGGKFKLRELMSVPMQRILKYHMLLTELLKHSVKSKSHCGDQLSLERAVAAMKDVAEYINEVKRDTETLQIIQDIENSISGLSLADTPFKCMRDCGRLLKDGEIKVKCHPDNRLRLRYAFVFDEVLLLCKSTKIVEKMLWGEQYTFKDVLSLRDYRVEEATARTVACDSSVATGAGGGDGRWSHVWHLVHRQQRAVYELHVKSELARQQWLSALQLARERQEPPECGYTDHQFVLVTFARAHECDTCLRLLKGVFRQGYRCSLCRRRAHRRCIRASGMCGARTLPAAAAAAGGDTADLCLVQLPQLRTAPRSQQSSPTRNTGVRLLRHSSLCTRSVSSMSVPSVLPSSGDMNNEPLPDYINLVLEEQLWWAGEMDRAEAERQLLKRCVGTYLVRVSVSQDNKCVLSLRTKDRVGHMKIREETVDCVASGGAAAAAAAAASGAAAAASGAAAASAGAGQQLRYSLSPARRFGSVLQLVQHYQRHSLEENFSGLHMTLQRPWRQQELAVVKYRYSHHGNAANVLSLSVGERVVIVSRDGESQGWWKGRIGDRTGYFPKSYVEEIL